MRHFVIVGILVIAMAILTYVGLDAVRSDARSGQCPGDLD